MHNPSQILIISVYASRSKLMHDPTFAVHVVLRVSNCVRKRPTCTATRKLANGCKFKNKRRWLLVIWQSSWGDSEPPLVQWDRRALHQSAGQRWVSQDGTALPFRRRSVRNAEDECETQTFCHQVPAGEIAPLSGVHISLRVLFFDRAQLIFAVN